MAAFGGRFFSCAAGFCLEYREGHFSFEGGFDAAVSGVRRLGRRRAGIRPRAAVAEAARERMRFHRKVFLFDLPVAYAGPRDGNAAHRRVVRESVSGLARCIDFLSAFGGRRRAVGPLN